MKVVVLRGMTVAAEEAENPNNACIAVVTAVFWHEEPRFAETTFGPRLEDLAETHSEPLEEVTRRVCVRIAEGEDPLVAIAAVRDELMTERRLRPIRQQ